MRRLRFAVPLLLFTGACNAPSLLAPPTAVGERPSTSVASDTTSVADAPADAEGGDGGILIGSGTDRGDGGIMMGSGGERETSPITMGSGG